MSGFNLDNFWAAESDEHKDVAEKTFATLKGEFGSWLDLCTKCIRNDGKILFFGNGGSAADAQHLATELAVRYIKDRDAIPSMALTTDTSALTAIGNDMGFDHLFSRQIEAIGKNGDVAIGITTSGNSANVIKALQKANQLGLKTVALTGRDGGKLNDLKYLNCKIVIPSNTTARIQEMHITLGQMLCGALEQRLGLV